MEGTGVLLGVDVADLEPGSGVITQVFLEPRPQLRLAGVEPPGVDSIWPQVVVPDPAPDERPRLGGGGVVERDADVCGNALSGQVAWASGPYSVPIIRPRSTISA